ncbi:hypothetical protein [Natrinema limicola]|uniref:PadR family transcriptional regulator n=1 Tax=Natrinema limicola JCM 13563 TaxID=1230457 RepID=M0CH02_9EURY|nr:hypothetical protein [Natrinema limicola]ELZ21637.1 PadR family transcriptional regulator [Natrinema limicola JCM 13563]
MHTDRSTQQTVRELSDFQRDLLFVFGETGPTKGVAVQDAIEDYYDNEEHHGRLYLNPDELAERGRQTLLQRHEWEAAKLGVSTNAARNHRLKLRVRVQFGRRTR